MEDQKTTHSKGLFKDEVPHSQKSTSLWCFRIKQGCFMLCNIICVISCKILITTASVLNSKNFTTVINSTEERGNVCISPSVTLAG